MTDVDAEIPDYCSGLLYWTYRPHSCVRDAWGSWDCSAETMLAPSMVRVNQTIRDDGTVDSSSGSVIHIGQIFFNEDILDQILATEGYSDTSNNRTYNKDDSILAQASADGATPFAETSLLGSSIEDGVLSVLQPPSSC